MSDIKRCKDLWDFYIMLEMVEPVMADELMDLIKQSELERHKAIEELKAEIERLKEERIDLMNQHIQEGTMHREPIDRLRFMIESGLGYEDMEDDKEYPAELS